MKQIAHLAKTYSDPSHWLKNISWRRPGTVSNLDCVFVVGSPRSGTTLLQRVLCTHSKLFSIEGETGLFSYQNIFDPKRRHFGLPTDTVHQLFGECVDIVDFFQRCVEATGGQNEGSRFVEKTPQHVLRTTFLRKHFPNATIINIVRDGRDCYCSSKSHPHIPQRSSAARFAKYWRDCIRSVIPVAENPNVHTIRYESLCEDPHASVGALMKCLNLELEANQLDTQHVGNDARASIQYFRRLNEAVGSSSVGRWHNELTDQEIQKFENIAGDELKHHGYELSRNH